MDAIRLANSSRSLIMTLSVHFLLKWEKKKKNIINDGEYVCTFMCPPKKKNEKYVCVYMCVRVRERICGLMN